uniref:Uncharacterized protein n=1 Tax=Dulem virus 54 TaxID=3145765 RepID=A0AAU8B6M3_9VIRU
MSLPFFSIAKQPDGRFKFRGGCDHQFLGVYPTAQAALARVQSVGIQDFRFSVYADGREECIKFIDGQPVQKDVLNYYPNGGGCRSLLSIDFVNRQASLEFGS